MRPVLISTHGVRDQRFCLLEQALVYLSVLLVKSCDVSTEICEMYGLGGTSADVYIFFVCFAVSRTLKYPQLCVYFLANCGHSSWCVYLPLFVMHTVNRVTVRTESGCDSNAHHVFFLSQLALLLLLLVVGLANLWFTGRVPKIILVAREHSVPPSAIVYRLAQRELSGFRQCAVHWLKFDRHRVPTTMIAIWRWRQMQGHMPHFETPATLWPVAVGSTAVLSIEGTLSPTTCFVQVGLASRRFGSYQLPSYVVTFCRSTCQLFPYDGRRSTRLASTLLAR